MRIPFPDEVPQMGKAVLQGSPEPRARMHPHWPMPDADGGLLVDPEIQLKAKKFSLSVNLYYSTRSEQLSEYGYGRSASIKTYLTSMMVPDAASTASGVSIVRGNLSEQIFYLFGTSGQITTYQSAENTANVTTLLYDSGADQFTEYYNDGMRLLYKKHASSGDRYEIDRAVDPDGVAQTYTYGITS